MDLKSLEDWVLEKQFKSVPNVVDVSSLGGVTREYQVRVDPDKLISYGLSIGQVEQQLTNNNVNAGGSFIEAGPAAGQRARGRPGQDRARHRGDGDQDAERNGAAGQGHRHRGARPEDPAGPERKGDSPRGRPDHRQRRRGGRHRAVAQGRQVGLGAGRHPRQGEGAERAHSASRREGGSVPRPQRPGALHHAHRSAQPDRGNHPGRHHPVRVSGKCPGRADRGADHSVFAAVRIHLSRPPAYSRQPAVAGRAGFRHGGGWRGGDGGEHRAAHGTPGRRSKAGHGPYSRGGARGPAAGFLRHRDHHHGVPADFHAAERGRPAVQAHGLDGGFRAAGRADLLDGDGAGAFELPVPRGHARVAQPGDGASDGALPEQPVRWAVRSALVRGRRGRGFAWLRRPTC